MLFKFLFKGIMFLNFRSFNTDFQSEHTIDGPLEDDDYYNTLWSPFGQICRTIDPKNKHTKKQRKCLQLRSQVYQKIFKSR